MNLAIMQPWYDRDVAAARRAGRSFPIFYRQGMFGTMPFSAIVYDGSDEIALPLNRRSPAWKAHALKTELQRGFVARPLWSHYYRTDIDCSTLPIP